jgi:hypothetical protein
MSDITAPNVTDPSDPTAAPASAPSSTTPDPAAPPASEPTGDKWYSGLSEDIRGNERIASFESVEALAKAYVDSPAPPSIPEASAYELPKDFPKEFGEFANKTGLTQDQVNSILKYNTDQMSAQSHAYERVQEAKLQELLSDWGDERDTNINLAKQVLRQFDTDDKRMTEFLRATKSGNNPIVLEFLSSIGQLLKEGDFLKSETTTPPSEKSLAAALYPKQASGE